MFRVDTTLSFARKPEISDTVMRQSPKPSGRKIGAIALAIAARMLAEESLTILRPKSKFCRNHTMMVPRVMIVKAFVRKSFAFSQSSCSTFFALGRR